MDIIRKLIIGCYIWYIKIKKYLRLKLCIIIWINGKFYRIISENIIHFKYGKQMINYCIKGGLILDQTLGQNSASPSHCACRILSPSIRENIALIFSLMRIFFDIWKEPKKRMFLLVNFGHNKKNELWCFPFSQTLDELYINGLSAPEKEIEYFNKFVDENPSPRAHRNQAPLISFSFIYTIFVPY